MKTKIVIIGLVIGILVMLGMAKAEPQHKGWLDDCYCTATSEIRSDGKKAWSETTASASGSTWQTSATAYFIDELTDETRHEQGGMTGGGPGGGGAVFNVSTGSYEVIYRVESYHKVNYNLGLFAYPITVLR